MLTQRLPLPNRIPAPPITTAAARYSSPPSPLPRDISSRFGIRVRELRRQHKLTQLRMAVEFGIDRTFISDVERGRKSVSLPTLEVLALGFRLSLSELLRDV